MQTTAEKSNYESTSTYNDVIQFIQTLEKSSDILRIENMATSTEGRDIPFMIIADPLPTSYMEIKDDERIVSSMMPCRISVYEKSDGKTYLSRINTKLLAANFEGAVKELMIVTTEEIEEMIKPVLK